MTDEEKKDKASIDYPDEWFVWRAPQDRPFRTEKQLNLYVLEIMIIGMIIVYVLPCLIRVIISCIGF